MRLLVVLLSGRENCFIQLVETMSLLGTSLGQFASAGLREKEPLDNQSQPTTGAKHGLMYVAHTPKDTGRLHTAPRGFPAHTAVWRKTGSWGDWCPPPTYTV
ncbi:hypothetical protein ILYODFUR_017470 [Ilyodon furcidens]|uniref:Uncharacterized protein n=1 Tax=Ilyodon furcidens TaxID=33524 RepID=A0ABV0UT12_9TELE